MQRRKSRSGIVVSILNSLPSCIEWYDFCLYIYLMPFMIHVFFSSRSFAYLSMISCATIAIGFITRSLGGFFFGRLADIDGRKKSLIYATRLMLIPTFLILILPSYHQIGVVAPIVLFFLRMLQGFSVGGEYAGLCVVAYENSQDHLKAFNLSVVNVAASAGVMLSSAVVFILSVLQTKQQIIDWGWRLPFLLGLILTLVSLSIQCNMDESKEYLNIAKQNAVSNQPIIDSIRNFPLELLTTFLLYLLYLTLFYTLVTYFPLYFQQHFHFNYSVITYSVFMGTFCYIVAVFGVGVLVSKWGALKVFFTFICIFLLFWTFFYPYLLLGKNIHPCIFLCISFVFVAGISIPSSYFSLGLFPTEIRSSAFSAATNLSCGMAGSAPFLYSVVVHKTAMYSFPVYLVLFLSLGVSAWLCFFVLRNNKATMLDARD